MAQRKGVIVTEVINSSDEWHNFLAKSGLCVVDAYQSWCGPCKPVQVLFKRLKTEIGATKVYFATADCEKIKELESYKGSCEPTFLFYGGAQLIGIVHGCNAPVIERLAVEKAETEVQIAQGKSTRVILEQSEVSEEVLEIQDHGEQSADEADDITPVMETLSDHNINKCIAIIVLNPEIAAEEDKVNAILNDIDMAGVEIVNKEIRQLTTDEVKQLYSNDISSDDIEKLTGGTALILAVTKGATGASSVTLSTNIITALDGPNHVSTTIEQAEHDLIVLFPDFNIPKVTMSTQLRESLTNEDVKAIETTLTIITPTAVEKYADDIIKDIEKFEFTIVKKLEYQFEEDDAKKFFENQTNLASDEALIANITSGPCLVLLLEKLDAISEWRNAIGPYENAAKEAPDSLRAIYTVDVGSAILANSNASQVKRDTEYFFGTESSMPTDNAPAEQEVPHEDPPENIEPAILE